MTAEELKAAARERRRAYNETHREQVAASQRKYQQTHREQIRAYQRAYRKAHPEKVKLWAYNALCAWKKKQDQQEAATNGAQTADE